VIGFNPCQLASLILQVNGLGAIGIRSSPGVDRRSISSRSSRSAPDASSGTESSGRRFPIITRLTKAIGTLFAAARCNRSARIVIRVSGPTTSEAIAQTSATMAIRLTRSTRSTSSAKVAARLGFSGPRF
jgi:hypothetical protein